MSEDGWRRSSFCDSAACIAVKQTPAGVQVRWTRPDFSSPFDMFNILLEDGMWEAFVAGVKDGSFGREWDAFVNGVEAGELDRDKL